MKVWTHSWAVHLATGQKSTQMQEALFIHSQNFNLLFDIGNFNTIYNMDGRQMPGKQNCSDLFDDLRVHLPNKGSYGTEEGSTLIVSSLTAYQTMRSWYSQKDFSDCSKFKFSWNVQKSLAWEWVMAAKDLAP